MKTKLWQVLLGSAVILSTVPVPAVADEVYQWVDKEGKVHFGDKKSATSSSTQVTQLEVEAPKRSSTPSRDTNNPAPVLRGHPDFDPYADGGEIVYGPNDPLPKP